MSFKASWTRVFFIFCQIITIFDDFSKFWSIFGVLQIEKASNIPKKIFFGKNEEKPCSTCLKTHFSMGLPKSETWVYFQVLIPSLVRTIFKMNLFWVISKNFFIFNFRCSILNIISRLSIRPFLIILYTVQEFNFFSIAIITENLIGIS